VVSRVDCHNAIVAVFDKFIDKDYQVEIVAAVFRRTWLVYLRFFASECELLIRPVMFESHIRTSMTFKPTTPRKFYHEAVSI
jgi:hypothetical protein